MHSKRVGDLPFQVACSADDARVSNHSLEDGSDRFVHLHEGCRRSSPADLKDVGVEETSWTAFVEPNLRPGKSKGTIDDERDVAGLRCGRQGSGWVDLRSRQPRS